MLIGRPAYTYFGPLVRGREHEIEVAFSADMDKTDLSEWFYNSTKDKPSDIGYWVGYRIAKSYYEKAADKTAALKDILEFSDAQAFLAASGWRPGSGSTE